MAGLMAVVAPLSVPVGPVPFTLGVLAVCFAAGMLPPAQAVASLTVYILLGAVGLPVFSGYRGGPQMLVGPTGGFIAGYFILVLAVSFACSRTRRLPWQMLASIAGLLLFYLVGTVWYSFISGANIVAGFMACVAPFIVADLLKVGLALAACALINRRMERIF